MTASIRVLSAVLSLVAFTFGTAIAQSYPTKPVRVIVVFPPGGATDVVSRFAFQMVSDHLN